MAATEPAPGGQEPLSADLTTRPPVVGTRALVVLVLVLAVLLLAGVVVGVALLHQPHLTPVPVPSVPSIP